jgi:hypothetical protein
MLTFVEATLQSNWFWLFISKSDINLTGQRQCYSRGTVHPPQWVLGKLHRHVTVGFFKAH